MKYLYERTNEEIVDDALCMVAHTIPQILSLIDFEYIKVNYTNTKDCVFTEKGLSIDVDYYRSVDNTNLSQEQDTLMAIILRSMISYIGSCSENYTFNQDHLDEYYTFLLKDNFPYFNKLNKNACYIKDSLFHDSVMENEFIERLQKEMMEEGKLIENSIGYAKRKIIKNDSDFRFSLNYECKSIIDGIKELIPQLKKYSEDINSIPDKNILQNARILLEYFEHVFEVNKYIFSTLIKDELVKIFISRYSKIDDVRCLVYTLC